MSFSCLLVHCPNACEVRSARPPASAGPARWDRRLLFLHWTVMRRNSGRRDEVASCVSNSRLPYGNVSLSIMWEIIERACSISLSICLSMGCPSDPRIKNVVVWIFPVTSRRWKVLSWRVIYFPLPPTKRHLKLKAEPKGWGWLLVGSWNWWRPPI